METLFEKLVPIYEKSMAFGSAMALLGWDNETLAPPKAIGLTSKALGIISGENYAAIVNDQVKDLLKQLSTEEENAKLTEYQKAIVKNLKKDFDEMEKIPAEEYQKFAELTSRAAQIWSNAKDNNDYASYKDTLQELFMYKKKFAEYCKKPEQRPYDYILDQYEEGFTTKILDDFFGKLKDTILPLMKEIEKNTDKVDDSFLYGPTDIEKQKEICLFLAKHIGFDLERGVMGESAHPFTTNLHKNDVRITNHFYPDNFTSSIFTVIHEGGHALYEQDIDDEIAFTPIGGGTSMGVHESQSRLYENNIGRSKEFWTPIYDKLVSTFPEKLKGVTLDQFYRAINASTPGLIRTDSDELTYCLHIMIRYEIEAMLFEGEASVDELPAIWNKKYEEYLGVVPANDSEGILQDTHWSFGGFGYFPSYAIGNAIAAQLMNAMKKEIPVSKLLENGNLAPIREYLCNHIHKWGGSKKADQLLRETTGEGFNPDYYINYLKNKYTEIYQL